MQVSEKTERDLTALAMRCLRRPRSGLATMLMVLAEDLGAEVTAAFTVDRTRVELVAAGGPGAIAVGKPGVVQGDAEAFATDMAARLEPFCIPGMEAPAPWNRYRYVCGISLLMSEEASCLLLLGSEDRIQDDMIYNSSAPVGLLAHVHEQDLKIRDMRLRARDAGHDHSLLVASLHHDLKTPLTSMIGSARTLLMHRERLAPDQQREFLESLVRQAERLTRMVNDVLTKSDRRSDSTIHKDRFNLRLVAERVAAAAAMGSSEQVIVEAPDLFITSDADRLERALLNLLDNALRYTPGGKPVHLVVEETVEGAALIVADNGPGVSDDLLPILFAPFTSDPTRADGTGLGLHSAKKMAEELGGRVSYSRGSGWTRFGISIPDLDRAE